MAYYIFTKGKRPTSEWELLETIERTEVAREVYKNYQQFVSKQDNAKIVMVKAVSAVEAKAELELVTNQTAA